MAHYDCSCCGEGMGISHDHCPRCQAGQCARGVTFRPGDIVRFFEKWGVCSGYKFAGVPEWDFFDEDGMFIDSIGSVDREISAPFDHEYDGIPEPVLVKATAYKLTENL